MKFSYTFGNQNKYCKLNALKNQQMLILKKLLETNRKNTERFLVSCIIYVGPLNRVKLKTRFSVLISLKALSI